MGKFSFSKLYNKHFLVLMGNGVIAMVGFATTLLLFHYLSVAAVGMWFFVQSIVGLCEAGRYGFLATTTVKFYAGTDEKRAANVLGSVWVLAISLTGVVLAANALALAWLPFTNDIETILCIKWIGITFLSSLPADVTFWRLQAQERYLAMLLYRMLNSGLSLLVFVILIGMNIMTVENALLLNFITNSIASLASIFLNLSGIKYIAHKSKDCIMELVHFGKYTFGTTLCSSMLTNSNTFILNFVLGPSAVAIYNLATRLMALIEMPLRTFVTTGLSEMAIAYNTSNLPYVTYILKKYAGMLTLSFLPLTIVALFIADFAIRILGGHNFDGAAGIEAANTYRFIMILALSYPIDAFNGLALDVIHKTKINFYKVILMLIVKVATGLLFTTLLKDIYGILIANYLMTIAAIIYGYYQLRKYLDYTIPGILITGYSEISGLIRRTLKLSPKTQSMP